MNDKAMTEAEAKETLRKLASDAIAVQDACNLSGVVHSFSRAMTQLWDVCRALNVGGTDWVNTHPICKMYASKINHLAQYDDSAYSAAHDVCDKLAK